MSNSSRPPALLNLFGPVQLRHMIAGMSGGVVSTLLLHPLDLLKIRFAVNDGTAGKQQYSSLGQAVRHIIQVEGLQGLYRGVVCNTVTAGSAWGSYFLFYQVLRSSICTVFCQFYHRP
jgi:solute carrier family 25 folate transporter 32